MTLRNEDGRLASRAREIDRSVIRVMYDMADAHEGELARLEVGEPDFDTPEHVVEAAFEAARSGETHYTPNAGIPELREAIADRYGEEDVPVDPDREIGVTTGAMEALHLAMLTVVDPGAEVVIPTPGWPNHATQTRLAGGAPVEVPLPADEGFALDAEAVTGAIGAGTVAVVLTRPSNPTGRVFDVETVREVATAAAEHGAYVIADEVYRDLVYEGDGRPIAALVEEAENVITVASCSKTYAMTGWRVGWLLAPEAVSERANAIHESTTACASSVGQHAALAALTGPEGPVREMRAEFTERREYVTERIKDLPGITAPTPEGAFYAFLDVREFGDDTLSIATTLLEEYGVVVAPGTGFGEVGEGHLRVSFAAGMEELERGFDGIEAFARAEAPR
ncbi:pyridoxal phosphate-dependent aminotransferase [Natronorarus salvus]|uniref:pyridoxal phosphate-dependent aminotransferase n=1 Tax=Natronorarus salvus TaxID=3117733 RepID=UPI002F2600A5